MKERIWGVGNKLYTVAGTAIGAAILGAASQYQASGGNVSNWQQYAIAGGAAMVMATGAAMKGKKQG